MTIEKTICIDININEIIKTARLTRSSSWKEVAEAVEHYIIGLEDCDYYNIDYNDITMIRAAVGNQIFTEGDNDIDDAKVAMRESVGENWW